MENLSEPKTQSNKPKIALVSAVIVLVFLAGYVFGNQGLEVKNGQISINRGQVSTSADYSLLWETLDLLNERFVDRPLDQKELLYGAVAGLVNAANDPYTVFFDPKEAEQFSEELKGTFEGIGAEIGIKNDQLVVVAPLEDTPASRAGLLPGDLILAINSESTSGLSIDQAVSKIRGTAGTEVVLTILHSNERSPKEVRITRGRIEVKSLKFETREINGKKIGIIKLNRFGEDAKGQFDHAVEVLTAGNYHGVVLDMRNNPGGFLETSIQIASNWVEQEKVVVKEVNYKSEQKDYNAAGLSRLSGLKTVVLVNGGSASASEIVAGALQDYKLATLVGEQTFGKGSVQELVGLKADSSIKITTAKWLTPSGRDINKNGLLPDIVVERTADDFNNDRDPQMDRALELLN